MRQNHTRIAIIRDRSGSMASIHHATTEALNEYIKGQQAAPGTADVLLVAFDGEYEVVYDKPLDEIRPMSDMDLLPRGSTALHDALGLTINSVGKKLADTPEDQRPDKVVIVTLSDGKNNSSQKFTAETVGQMIEHQRTVYKWEFIFLGTNQDAVLTAASLNIPQTAALSYSATSSGVRSAMRSANAYTVGVRSGQTPSFTSVDRESAKESGATGAAGA